MAKLLKLRRGSTSDHSGFTGAAGECTVDTDKATLVVHDNSTAGGRPLLREDLNNLGAGSIALAHMASQSVDEDNLYISNAGSNGQFLQKQTGNNGGLTWATVTTTPTDITIADESSDTTCFPLFVTAATGDLEPKTGSNLAFNSSSGALTATSFAGDGSNLTGISVSSAGGSVYECVNTISSNYTMTTNSNGVSAGPITVSATVTIPSGSVWSIV